jgi:D-alanyl-D-alanine carboxypeptidase/D-alanyl-D-alanine-endopeptidase (penicillin-binding protein 4)
MIMKSSTYSLFIFCFLFFISITSCSLQKQISKSATADVLTNKALTTAHVGISVFEPATNKYWYEYQGDHYFVPASNTKIPTCYAAMKYLGDSLVGLRVIEFLNDKVIYLFPTGDPSFLVKDFYKQPVLEYLKQRSSYHINFFDTIWREQPLGLGWSWNDYDADYMAERSSFPIFGNVLEISGTPELLSSVPTFRWRYQSDGLEYLSSVAREFGSNRFSFSFQGEKKRVFRIPFATLNCVVSRQLLSDTLHQSIDFEGEFIGGRITNKNVKEIKSQKTDTLLKIMMHRSDNFFAEQSLLMVSNERLGYMNDEKIIDTLLKTDFKDLPQKPRWVDGSGLSRYNLFSPKDFVSILNKMKNDFGMDRIKVILATGGEGTISSYYKADSGYIYGKTGTLSGVVAFSGFLYTKKGKLLIFSTLVNNHQASATEVRHAIEKFLQGIRNQY